MNQAVISHSAGELALRYAANRGQVKGYHCYFRPCQ